MRFPVRWAIGGGPAASRRSLERLPYEQLRRVRPNQVRRAVELLSAGKPHNFSESRDFDLLTPKGEPFPPKAVFGFALRQLSGLTLSPLAGSVRLRHEALEGQSRTGLPKNDGQLALRTTSLAEYSLNT